MGGALFRLLTQTERFRELDQAIMRARASPLGAHQTLIRVEAIAAIEQGQSGRALTSCSKQCLRTCANRSRYARHSAPLPMIRGGSGKRAGRCRACSGRRILAAMVWPYATIAWRLAGDPRWQWLEGDLDRFVSVIDLRSKIEDFGALEQVLRGLHANKGEFLDQSVRGGSQTDGPLFTKIDPSDPFTPGSNCRRSRKLRVWSAANRRCPSAAWTEA